MHGARHAAFDYLRTVTPPSGDQRLWRSGVKLLDVCSGNPAWLYEYAKRDGLHWSGMDCRPNIANLTPYFQIDLSREPMPFRGSPSDLAVSVYGMQHLQNGEAFAWHNLRLCLKDGGHFIYFGNHSEVVDQVFGVMKCYRNTKREDPANVHSRESIHGLALATGFEVLNLKLFAYAAAPSEDYDMDASPEGCNGLIALLRTRT